MKDFEIIGLIKDFEIFEIIGSIGAALMVATSAMKAMIPLRVVGIASNIFQIAFALSVGITPMLSNMAFFSR